MVLKQPRSLLDQASYVLGTEIGERALLFTEKNYSEIKNISRKRNVGLKLNIRKCAEFYDETIPQNLHNIVTYHTLKYLSNNNLNTSIVEALIFNVSELVLRCHVTRFSYFDWPSRRFHSILHRIWPKLKDSKFLFINLKPTVHTVGRDLNYVLQGIESMKQLETFICTNCSDHIVKVLCDNCPLINLDISESRSRVTDTSVPLILKLQNLRRLNILGTKISKKGQKQLLLGLSHLEGLMSDDLNLVLREIGDENVTSLQAVKYYCSHEYDLTYLTKVCPSVRKLDVGTHKEFHFGSYKDFDLSEIADLKCLTSLHIERLFHERNIFTRNYQITELDIHLYRISISTLYKIDMSCPNLMKLSINCDSFKDDEAEFLTNNGKVFQNLEDFSSHMLTSIPACLIFILRNCIKLKKVEFIHAQSFCDSHIDEILDCNPLVNLQKLFFEEHQLTVESVYKLLTSCKQLRYLGYTGYWQTITRSELDELRDYVWTNNLNIEFLKRLGEDIPSVMLYNVCHI